MYNVLFSLKVAKPMSIKTLKFHQFIFHHLNSIREYANIFYFKSLTAGQILLPPKKCILSRCALDASIFHITVELHTRPQLNSVTQRKFPPLAD